MNKVLSTMMVLAAVAGFSGAAQAQDAKAGGSKAAMCIGCHSIPGYQSSFPEVHKVPMIAGQNAQYIVAALNAYKKGERKHPTMRGIADTLSEQDMADLAAYYEALPAAQPVPEQPAKQPSAEVAALLQKGACVSCHGANFSKPIDGSYPKIAGQHPDYLYVALKSYKTEGNPYIGRANAIMAGQVKQFSNAELKAIAQYIGSLPGEMKVVPQSRFR
ncbi:cytochrome c4 [Caldimonas thermodepolymerans]|uniref:Cytochrome c4 n=1 Tax=Caldimonas thermodepolymerans TaxID=215580 RepID=A0A2S5T9P8_9BURK|nr:c-type cytochrome [Caldimonas thermodepolymerans]PPE71713.1 cytochrome c4 [Caldimonas thermodepolymerans]QPC30739.1 cytochrome c4 [Caldimonas thermodepolymerans]RDI02641.1 cytochrome c553 [Caldimonas thermodepolymerans]